MQWILGSNKKSLIPLFYLSHVSLQKWRSKRRVLGFLWLLGTNFVGLAGETSFTQLNLSRKNGRGPMTFHSILIFLSGMFYFLVEFLAYWGMNMINAAAKPTFAIQIRDICRLSWGLAPPWRLSRGGLAYCGLYFLFLSWNWRFTPKFVEIWMNLSWKNQVTNTFSIPAYVFFYETPLLKKVVWQEISQVLLDFWSTTCDFLNLPILTPDQAVESSPGQVGLRRKHQFTVPQSRYRWMPFR